MKQIAGVGWCKLTFIARIILIGNEVATAHAKKVNEMFGVKKVKAYVALGISSNNLKERLK